MSKSTMTVIAATITIVVFLSVSAIPVTDATEGDNTTEFNNIGDFFDVVENNNYVYDGKGVTVRWSPTSKCDGYDLNGCLFGDSESKPTGDGNTPNRGQVPNAQYQYFGSKNIDIGISNVNFVYEPGDFKLCINSGWKGSYESNEVLNAELQLNNTGSVTFQNCTFDHVIVSPFGSTVKTEISNCTFNNIFDTYAIKDIHSAETLVTGCTFINGSGGVYLEGNIEKTSVTITDNKFYGMDQNASDDDKNMRGLIQLSAAGDYSNAVFDISDNSSDNDAALLRLLNDSVDVSKISLEDNLGIDGPLLTPNSNHIQIGDRYYATFEEAVEAIKSMSGDVTVIINGNLDLTKVFADSANNTIEYDLSTSKINSLTIRGADGASITSGVDGHGIDGDVYCPVLRFNLPEDVDLAVKGIIFENDLWIDNRGDGVTFTGCTFHGAISVYPQSVEVTFYENTFQFLGTPSKFHSGNAYPVWFKIEENTEFKFIKNIVTGPRGVHIENRENATTNISVDNNVFNLTDRKNENKTIALQLFSNINGIVSFTGNEVDAYMAICLFSGTKFTGTIEFADNTLSEGCKEFGSNEWGSNETTADNFAASLLPARVGDVYYPSLSAAIDAAESGPDNAVVLVNDITVDTWDMIWNISGVTIEGQEHTIKVNGIESGDNHDAIFHSAGGNTFKNLIIDMSGITADSNIGGFRAISASAGDVIQNVTVIGNEYVEYGITVAGTEAEGESILVDGCVFRDCGYGVFSDNQTGLEKLTIEECTFEGCEYATILYPEESEFIGNSVSGGKLNIMHPGQLITGNTFNDVSRIKFYDTPGEFSKNKVSDDSYLDYDGVTGPVDVSENYWGGGEPSDSQLGGASGIVSWTNYYLDEAMTQRSDDPVPEPEPGDDTPIIPPIDDDDDYVPPIYVPSGSSSSDDDTVKIVACAAAAVVAAIMAAFLILGHRRD